MTLFACCVHVSFSNGIHGNTWGCASRRGMYRYFLMGVYVHLYENDRSRGHEESRDAIFSSSAEKIVEVRQPKSLARFIFLPHWKLLFCVEEHCPDCGCSLDLSSGLTVRRGVTQSVYKMDSWMSLSICWFEMREIMTFHDRQHFWNERVMMNDQ